MIDGEESAALDKDLRAKQARANIDVGDADGNPYSLRDPLLVDERALAASTLISNDHSASHQDDTNSSL